MFEVYAVIASLLLPTGILSLIYFVYHMKSCTTNPIIWTLIFESIATVLLGVFYMYSAIILSQKSVTNDISLVNNNIDDIAIVNDTLIDEIDVPTFFEVELPPSDQNNEIEDTRNNKNKATPSQFLQKYQNLVQASIRNKLRNATREERSLFHQRLLAHARTMKDEVATDTLEDQDCFLRRFFYQALLVYSFVTSALSLLNTCGICQQCSKDESPAAIKPIKSENPSESFGEKIADDVSDNSSRNAAPVGPLFDADSVGGSTPNLEVFSVKKSSSQVQLSAKQPETPPREIDQEPSAKAAGKCVLILVLPMLLVIILYFLMKSGSIKVENIETNNILTNFNDTNSDIQTAKLINENNTQQKEITEILNSVYTVINKFQEDHKYAKIPAATGQYLHKSKINNNSTIINDECVGNETNLKTFDFIIFVLLFFVVIFYTKLTEAKMSRTASSQNINKCIMAFFMLWAPGVLDAVASRLLTDREPNIFSTLLLLLGNLDRLYSTKQNVGLYNTYGRRNVFVTPVSQQKV